jgi:hypothetical protein
VAVIDSGVEADHPLLEGSVDTEAGVEFTVDESGRLVRTDGPHRDVYGHGTACAGIIHALAPEAGITSIRVLDEGLRGRAAAFHAGLSWAVDEQFDVINLSLGAARREWALAFHDICDRGYFANSFIVTAANNVDRDSFPSLYASVTSVAANTATDPLRYHFNPEPPTEFLARGIDVEVPWRGGTTVVTTGNSFAAPHISAFAALVKAEHPEMRPFQVKTALWAAAANVREQAPAEPAGRRATVRLSRSAGGPRSSLDRNPPTVLEAQPMGGPPSQRPPAARPATPDPRVTDHRSADRPITTTPLVVTDGGEPAPTNGGGDSEHAGELEGVLGPGYQLGAIIERGPCGTLYAARRAGRAVLVHRLDPPSTANGSRWQHRLRRLGAVAAVRHPHLVPVLEMRVTERLAVLVRPRHRTTVAAELASGPIAPAAAVAATVSVLWGLHAAHATGVVHGAFRPGLAVVDQEGRVAVSGVGVAAALAADGRATSTATDRLSWSHLAPEQLEGGTATVATDVHAAGQLAFELLTGDLPFTPVADLGALIRQRASTDPRPLATLAPWVDPVLAAAVDRAIAVEPGARPRSAAEFAHGLVDAAHRCLGPEWAASQPFVLDVPGAPAPAVSSGAAAPAPPPTAG